MLRSQTLRCRASVFNIWYLFCTQNWSLYFNLLTSGVDFARILRVFGLTSQNRFLFGLLPITEGKSLGSALLPRISNITEKLLYKSGAFWLWFCRNQSVVTGLEKKKTKFLWPTSEHKGIRLENAILFLDGDIHPMSNPPKLGNFISRVRRKNDPQYFFFYTLRRKSSCAKHTSTEQVLQQAF